MEVATPMIAAFTHHRQLQGWNNRHSSNMSSHHSPKACHTQHRLTNALTQLKLKTSSPFSLPNQRTSTKLYLLSHTTLHSEQLNKQNVTHRITITGPQLAGLHLGGGEGGPSPPLGTLLPPLELNSNILLY